MREQRLRGEGRRSSRRSAAQERARGLEGPHRQGSVGSPTGCCPSTCWRRWRTGDPTSSSAAVGRAGGLRAGRGGREPTARAVHTEVRRLTKAERASRPSRAWRDDWERGGGDHAAAPNPAQIGDRRAPAGSSTRPNVSAPSAISPRPATEHHWTRFARGGARAARCSRTTRSIAPSAPTSRWWSCRAGSRPCAPRSGSGATGPPRTSSTGPIRAMGSGLWPLLQVGGPEGAAGPRRARSSAPRSRRRSTSATTRTCRPTSCSAEASRAGPALRPRVRPSPAAAAGEGADRRRRRSGDRTRGPARAGLEADRPCWPRSTYASKTPRT